MARDDHGRHADPQAMGSRGDSRREALDYRALVVQLASELYRRDHGTMPLWDEALVGPYLKELPDDGLGDGETATGRRRIVATGVTADDDELDPLSRNFPTLRYLAAPFRWLFGSRRRARRRRRCCWR